MVDVQNIEINNIPSLVVTSSNKQNEPLPTVIYSHGFTSSKEFNLPIAYLLAAEGYRVVLPDSLHHGERAGQIQSVERQGAFWHIVLQNLEELKTIRNYFADQNLIENDLVGVAGTSMGGITTAAALTQYDWIHVAAILMGSPKMTEYANLTIDQFLQAGELPVTEEELNTLLGQLKSLDLSLQPDKLENRPLLFWHGESDTVVPAEHAKSFYENVKGSYENGDHIRLLLEANRNHKVSRRAVLETVEWFKQYLS